MGLTAAYAAGACTSNGGNTWLSWTPEATAVKELPTWGWRLLKALPHVQHHRAAALVQHIPDAAGAIVGTGQQQVRLVRVEGDVIYGPLMAFQHSTGLPHLGVTLQPNRLFASTVL